VTETDESADSSRRRSALLSNARFRMLWSARAVSFVGDGMATISLLLYVKETSGNGFSVAALLLASTLPRLAGPVAGTVADRVPPKRLMVSCDLGQALIFAAVVTSLPPLPVLLVLVATASTLATLFRPAGSSLVPRLVPPEELLYANAWIGTALNLQIVLGPPLGGAAFETLGIRGSLAVNAGTFVVSALLLSRLDVPPIGVVAAAAPTRFLTDFCEGLAFVFQHRLLRMVVVTLFFSVLFAAVDNVALVFLARDNLHASPIGYGLTAAVFGVGMVVATLTLTRLGQRSSAFAVYRSGLVLSGVGTLATGVATGLPFAAAAQVCAGAGNGANNVGGDTLIQQHAPPAMLGRAFGLVGTAAVLGGSLASLLAGLIVEVASARAAFLVGGAGVLATAIPAILLAAERPRPRTRG
jgi:MFS family permease